MNGDVGFLSRWSRRKAQVREGVAVEPQAPAPAAAELAPTPAVATAAASDPAPAPALPDEPAAPLPTMDDVAKLTRDSDFSAYLAQGVDEDVQRAAMKKLFADPRYNVMDGLDVYIDDYTQAAPIPPALLRKMTQAAVLKLFDDEAEAPATTQPAAPAPGAGPGSATPDLSEGAADEDPDLRLQPDDAAGRPGPAEGTRA